MYVIGMTGGVGSGKTQAACLLKEIASAELLIADELGHVAMEKGTDGYDEIIESFGTDILDADGQISRTVMAEKVFHDKERLALLNGIIHPKVKAYIRQYIDDRKDQEGVLILEFCLRQVVMHFVMRSGILLSQQMHEKNVCVKTEDIRMKKAGQLWKDSKVMLFFTKDVIR